MAYTTLNKMVTVFINNTYIHTHRDHTSDLIICPMLCYSNGTDKKH